MVIPYAVLTQTIKWVKNISDRSLVGNEVSVLAKVLNFAVVPDMPPITTFVTCTETAIRQARLTRNPRRNKLVIPSYVITKLLPPNITKEERTTLSDIRKGDNIVKVPVDKGRCVVVLNKPGYDKKCPDLLKHEITRDEFDRSIA